MPAPAAARATRRSPPAPSVAPREERPAAGSFTVRLGPEALAVSLVRGEDGTLRGDLTSYGIRRGGVLLTEVLVEPAGGWASGSVEAPFVTGTARFALDETGRATGAVSLDASVSVLGATLARVAYAEERWADTPLPVPAVAVDGASARIGMEAPRGTLRVDTGTGLRPAESLAMRVPLGEGAVLPDVSGSVGAPLDSSLAERLTTLLAQPLPDLVVHTDAVADEAVARLGVAGMTVGSHLYFGRGAFDPVAGLDLLVRLVGQALAGMTAPAGTPPDPTPAEPQATPGEPALPSTAPPEPVAAEGAAPATLAPPEEAAPGAAPAASGPAPDGAAPEAAAPGGAGSAGGTGEEPAPVESLIPPAPTEPGPAQQERARAVGGGAGGAARAATALPTAEENTGDARGAVTPPDAEGMARAKADLAEALGTRPEPNPELVALCDSIRAAIRAKRPVDEEHLVEARPEEMARESGQAMNASVEGDANRVRGSYDEMGQTPSPAPTTPGTPVTPPSPGVDAPPIDAERAAPDAVPPENVSLDADRAHVDQRISDANIERPSTEPIQEPPFSTVREGRDELGQMGEARPAEVLAQQDEALNAARADMATLQQQALAALTASRSQTVGGTGTQQTAMVGSEQQTRESVSRQAQQIFDTAQTRVNALLEPMSRTAMATWTAGVQRHSTEFRQELDRVKRWIDERHSGVGGAILGAWDSLTGLPGWVVETYDRAERLFGDRICDLLLEISADVESVVAAAQAVIEQARTDIDTLFSNLPAELQGWAAEQQAQFAERLDGLQARVTTARDDFNRDISQAAVDAVAKVQHEIEQLRAEAGGLIGQIVAAIDAFLEDPVKAIIDGLLAIVGIPPGAFWALVARIQQVAADIANDPMNFVNNLVAAIRAGFEGFFSRFPEHLMQGFFDWLFSGLGAVGVQIPADTSLPSLVTFALQLMGITWPRVREILVRHVGEQNVALIEQIWQLVSTLITQGPQGIFEMLKERLDPAAFVQQIISAAVQYVVEKLVQQVAMRIIALFNPAGAIVQAIEIIYRVLSWVFQNAARIFRFVETVVNGMAAIIAGDTAGTAAAIETALASLLPPVIDFLAGFLGLGDLPEKVADVIKGLQDYVYGIMDAVIGWLVERGRALLQALGIGGDPAGNAAGGDTELGESVTFSGGDESHRLWVQRNDNTAVLKVASSETTVRAKVLEWSNKVGDVAPAAEQTRARGLLAQAHSLLGITEAELAQLAPAFEAAENAQPAVATTTPAPGATAPAQPDDSQVEAKEHELANVLSGLFAIFDRPGRDEALRKIREGLPSQVPSYVSSAHSHWRTTYLEPVAFAEGLKPDGTLNMQRLFSGVALDGTQSAAVASAGSPAVAESLVEYFLGASPPDSANTAEFLSWAVDRTSFRLPFLRLLGPPAVEESKRAARARLTRMQPDYQQEWEGRLGEIQFDESSGRYGAIRIPRELPTGHKLYEPLDITPDTSNPTEWAITYRTISGQSFRISRPLNVGFGEAVQARGNNLQIIAGRSYTTSAEVPGFVRGQNMQRAHLIANMLTGSGYKSGQNLLAASQEYNGLMSAVERRIAEEAALFAELNERDVLDVRLNMTVTAEVAALLEASVLAEIEARFPQVGDARAAIQAKLSAATISRIRRIMSVFYEYTMTLPGHPTAGEHRSFQSIDSADIWLIRL